MNNMPYPNSYYAASANPFPDRPQLNEGIDIDVCVIGAGYSGLSAAIEIAEQGHSVIVLEQAKVGWGASGRNGGQIVNGWSRDLDVIESRYGQMATNAISQWVLEGGDLIRSRVKKYNIQCDLKDGNIFAAYTEKQMRELEAKVALWNRFGMNQLEMLDQNEIKKYVNGNGYIGGLLDSKGGHMHPLNLALGEASALEFLGGRIYEKTKVTSVDSHAEGATVNTSGGKVRARKLVVCGNAYLGGAVPELTSKVMPVSTQIIASEPLTESQANNILPSDMCVEDVNFLMDYFRLSGDRRLIFGGGSTYGGAEPGNIYAKLRPKVSKVFPQLDDIKFEYAWGGNFALTLTRIPHMGQLNEHIYFVHGYSGHGVTGSHTCGKILGEAINGNKERFNIWAKLPYYPFPGGRLFRVPAVVAGSWWYILRDKLGI